MKHLNHTIKGINFTVKPGEAMLAAQDVQGVVINELLIDPNGAMNFDADGDGNTESDDEYIELFNTTAADVDISGWTVSDLVGLRYTFPSGSIIPAGGHVILISNYDGPMPMPSNVFDAGQAAWMNNGGDVITISDGSSSMVASYGGETGGDYFGSDMDGLSISRTPDGGMTFDNTTTPTPSAQNPCFLEGTLIMTAAGEVAVENLKEGDLIVTADGKTTPVQWLGYRSVQVEGSYDQPICITAGSIAEDIPNRDLFVSPNHAVHIDGLLINAGALVNGTTIKEVEMSEDFKYYHVELAQHELILSDGMATESYLPQHEDRMDFDNGHEVDGEAEIMLFPLPYPRITAAYNVPAEIKERLGRAGMRKTA